MISNILKKYRYGRPIRVAIMGDPHAHPNYDNKRFELAGWFAARNEVDVVVCLGDWADMPSLSDYDRKKRSFEGRRYRRDLAAAHEAMELFDEGFVKEQQRMGSRHGVDFFMCGGNHDEDRIGRMTQVNPELDGMLDFEIDLKYAEYGWNVVPYKQAIDINGMAFSHFFASGVMGRPITGERPALSLINKLHTSACVGHSHLYDRAHRTRPDGSRVIGISAGWFGHPDHREGWNLNTAHLYWNGLLLLKGLYKGDGTLEEFSQEELWEAYARRFKRTKRSI